MKALACLAVGLLAPVALPGPPPASALPWLAAWGVGLALGLVLGPLMGQTPQTGLAARLSCGGRLLLLSLLGCLWSLAAMQGQLERRVPDLATNPADRPTAADVLLDGQVVGLAQRRQGRVQFAFRVHAQAPAQSSSASSHGVSLAGRKLLVRWYEDAPPIRTGQRWRLALRVQPPRGRVNFSGADTEGWYFANGLDGIATVSSAGGIRLPGGEAWSIHHWRERLGDRLRQTLAGHPGLGMVLALALADRSALEDSVRESLRATGTGHLLAISGLHVGMVAMLGLWGGRLLGAWPFHRAAWSPMTSAWILAMTSATAYSALAGFGVSTRRALVMLTVVAICAVARRRVAPLQGLLLALVVVLLIDPRSPAQAGFWLSFLAVAVLLGTFAPREASRDRVRILLRAQFAVSVVTWPLGLLWFQHGAGPVGLAVNLLAIPWVGMLTLPLVLMALLLIPLEPLLGRMPLELVAFMAAESAVWLIAAIDAIRSLFPSMALLTGRPAAWAAALAMLGAAALTLPRGMPWRWLGLLLCLPLLMPMARPAGEGALRLELLDVGQGTAVLLETKSRMLLYDTGPGSPQRWDLVAPVLRPAFSSRGRSPDWVLVSHADLDHAGGAWRLHRELPDAHWLASSPPGRSTILPALPACDDRRRWRWDGVDFRVLHPSPWLPYQGNDSSCVLSVTGPHASILLPGDVGRVVERRLVAQGLGRHLVMLAAHHGSRSSSDPRLLRAVAPRWVLISAGAGNRFGFPHREVVARLHNSSGQVLSTAACGAIRLELRADGRVQARSARRDRGAPWRWPAAPACP